MSTGTAPSLTQSVAPLDTGAHVTAIGWLKGTAAFGLGDGGVLLARDGETHRVEAHPDAGVLVAASDGERLVTGGDDGRVAVTGPDGSTKTLAETKGAWIDSLAVNSHREAQAVLQLGRTSAVSVPPAEGGGHQPAECRPSGQATGRSPGVPGDVPPRLHWPVKDE